MDSGHCDCLSVAQYSRWGSYRDDAYTGSGLRTWELDALARHFPREGSLLVGAAGGGREVVALCRRGFRVDAFECVDALVDYCREALPRLGVSARVLPAAPNAVPAGLGAYDGLIVGWGGYMHIAGRSRRVAFLRSLRGHVDPGAPLLLSFFARTDPSRALRLTFRIASALRRLRRSTDAVEYGDTLDGTFDHRFVREEVASELAAGGFELVAYATEPYGHAVGRAVAP